MENNKRENPHLPPRKNSNEFWKFNEVEFLSLGKNEKWQNEKVNCVLLFEMENFGIFFFLFCVWNSLKTNKTFISEKIE